MPPVLDDALVAAVVLVFVLATASLVALTTTRRRRRRRALAAHEAASVGTLANPPAPDEGWLAVEQGRIELTATPAPHLALPVALDVAALAAEHRPGDSVLDWFRALGRHGRMRSRSASWDKATTRRFFALLRSGNGRSWRFLEATGVLEAALPELADAAERRRRDPTRLDPGGTLRWDLVDALDRQASGPSTAEEWRRLDHEEWLVLAGLILDVTGGEPGAVATARQLVKRLDLGAAAEQEIALLVGERGLLRAAAGRPDGFTENAVLQLAAHLQRPERARALLLLSLAEGELDEWEEARLRELHDLLQVALSSPDLSHEEARRLPDRRKAEAIRLAHPDVAERIEHAPRPYLLATDAAAVAAHAELVEPLPRPGTVRVRVNEDAQAWHWQVDVAAHDRPGLLAAVALALAEHGLDVLDAQVATWPDGAAIESFRVTAEHPPSADHVQTAVCAALDTTLSSGPVLGAEVEFDDEASPWYTLCRIEAPDAPGRLHSLAVAISAAGASVHAAQVFTSDRGLVDRFELTDRRGAKLGTKAQDRIVAGLREGARVPAGRWPRRHRSAPGPAPGTADRETSAP